MEKMLIGYQNNDNTSENVQSRSLAQIKKKKNHYRSGKKNHFELYIQLK